MIGNDLSTQVEKSFNIDGSVGDLPNFLDPDDFLDIHDVDAVELFTYLECHKLYLGVPFRHGFPRSCIDDCNSDECIIFRNSGQERQFPASLPSPA